jgi:hypothetical protein
MALGGGVFGITSLLAFAIQVGLLPLPAPALGWIWLASGLAFALALPALNRRTRTRPGAASSLNESMGVVWNQAGIAIWVLFVAVAAVAGGPLLWLAYAVALFALGLAPGLILMRQEGRR